MVEDNDREEDDKKEDKFDAFTPEGEAIGYISLEQAEGSRYADRQRRPWRVRAAVRRRQYGFRPGRAGGGRRTTTS